MKDKGLQYIPILGFPAARRELKRGKEHSVIGAETAGEFARGMGNYLRYGVICAENFTASSGLVYLCMAY